MTGRAQRGGQSQSAANANANRQNEYFVPRDGIDREVITADICRYLGNDALVRPGTYPDQESGRTIQGYYITAYRNLTTAMIADLKNDSARWDQERRRHQSGAVRYTDSAIRDVGSRSHSGYGAGAGRDYEENLRYPGSDAPGYSAGMQAASGVYGQQYQQAGTYGAQYGNAQTTGYSATDPRYTQSQMGPVAMAPGYTMTPVAAGGTSSWVPGADIQVQSQGYSSMDATMTDAASYARGAQTQAAGYTAGSTRQAYPPNTVSQAGYYTQPATASAAHTQQPQDVFFGRRPATETVASSVTLGYGSASPDPQYEQHPTSRSGMATSNTQTQASSSANSDRRGRPDREPRERGDRSDRNDRNDRHHDRDEPRSRKHHYSSGR